MRYPSILNRRKWRPKEEMGGNGRAREVEREREREREGERKVLLLFAK